MQPLPSLITRQIMDKPKLISLLRACLYICNRTSNFSLPLEEFDSSYKVSSALIEVIEDLSRDNSDIELSKEVHRKELVELIGLAYKVMEKHNLKFKLGSSVTKGVLNWALNLEVLKENNRKEMVRDIDEIKSIISEIRELIKNPLE